MLFEGNIEVNFNDDEYLVSVTVDLSNTRGNSVSIDLTKLIWKQKLTSEGFGVLSYLQLNKLEGNSAESFKIPKGALHIFSLDLEPSKTSDEFKDQLRNATPYSQITNDDEIICEIEFYPIYIVRSEKKEYGFSGAMNKSFLRSFDPELTNLAELKNKMKGDKTYVYVKGFKWQLSFYGFATGFGYQKKEKFLSLNKNSSLMLTDDLNRLLAKMSFVNSDSSVFLSIALGYDIYVNTDESYDIRELQEKGFQMIKDDKASSSEADGKGEGER